MTPAAYLRSHRDTLTGLLKSLVSIPTVNPPGENYDAITALLVDELRLAGLQARRLAIPRNRLRAALPKDQWAFPRWNVVGTRKVKGATKTLHFNAHYDVVPVSGNWRHTSPFSGVVTAGWQYGRGTADMKGSIASLLLALRALKATGVTPAMNLEVSFTADEETDSVLGAEWLVNHGPVSPDYAVVMEGGEGDLVCCGHNGVVWLNVRVLGKAAHGSTPEKGINALEKMSALVLALEKHKGEITAKQLTTPDGKVMKPTLNVGGVFAQGPGGKINTVPAEAVFSIDRRVIATEKVEEVEAQLRAFLQRAAAGIPDCRISIEKVSENHPCYTSPDQPFFAAMASLVGQVRKRPAQFCVSSGFNDMHFFAHALGIPTVGYGPGGRDCHAVDERVPVKDLVQSAEIYARLMAEFTG